MNELTKKEVKIESVLSQLENLNDQEILEIFANKEINISVKQKILEKAYERINKLNTQAFIEVFSWLEDSNVLPYYLNHIEKFTYEEFVEFLYNGIYAEKIILSLIESNIYKKHLEEEKTKELGISIQIISLEKELFLVENNVKQLDTIGTEIIKLINKSKKQEEKEEMYSLIQRYLDEIIKNMDSFPMSCASIERAFEILRIQMKNHEVLTPKMVEFYLLFRTKELNLRSICKDVIVTLGGDFGLAKYSLAGGVCKNGTLKINYEDLMSSFEKYRGKIPEKALNDTINILMLPMLSHELHHAIDMKEYLEIKKNKENEEFINIITTNKVVNREIRNHHLREIVGEEDYDNRYHDRFIDETRADIFSYFDTNNQLLTRFKNCYEFNDIAGRLSFFARLLVKKYTNEEGKFISPMEQFNAYYNENIKETERIPIAEEEETDIFHALLNGEPIPIELYEFLKQIASAKIITDDLETTIKNFINDLRTEEILQGGPAL